jgi:hypothetical protein
LLYPPPLSLRLKHLRWSPRSIRKEASRWAGMNLAHVAGWKPGLQTPFLHPTYCTSFTCPQPVPPSYSLFAFWNLSLLFFPLFALRPLWYSSISGSFFWFFFFFFFLVVLGFELRASHLLGRHFTIWVTLPALFLIVYFQDRVSQTICPGWLPTMILLISTF